MDKMDNTLNLACITNLSFFLFWRELEYPENQKQRDGKTRSIYEESRLIPNSGISYYFFFMMQDIKYGWQLTSKSSNLGYNKKEKVKGRCKGKSSHSQLFFFFLDRCARVPKSNLFVDLRYKIMVVSQTMLPLKTYLFPSENAWSSE